MESGVSSKSTVFFYYQIFAHSPLLPGSFFFSDGTSILGAPRSYAVNDFDFDLQRQNSLVLLIRRFFIFFCSLTLLPFILGCFWNIFEMSGESGKLQRISLDRRGFTIIRLLDVFAVSYTLLNSYQWKTFGRCSFFHFIPISLHNLLKLFVDKNESSLSHRWIIFTVAIMQKKHRCQNLPVPESSLLIY